ncbi:MAG: SDR family NAD(P)-dependent oxidoreductase, partial [Cyclobacteriaceae bacterium]|nr:SDR family NAD(P)-dependent oxidoreductase [Cyclobacteriaceae bacterium]
MISLKNKISIITGGARGIGNAIAHMFSRLEATVHIFDIDETNGRRVVEEIRENGFPAFFHHCDVSDFQ